MGYPILYNDRGRQIHNYRIVAEKTITFGGLNKNVKLS